MSIVQKLYIWNHHINRNNGEVKALEKHYISSNFEEKISFKYSRHSLHEYLKNVSARKKMFMLEYIIPRGFFNI